MRVGVGRHRHLIVRHKHPDYPAHSNRWQVGFKPCDRWHWHFWWEHSHVSPHPPKGG